MKRTDRIKWPDIEIEITVPGDYKPDDKEHDDLAAEVNWQIRKVVLEILESIKGVEVEVWPR